MYPVYDKKCKYLRNIVARVVRNEYLGWESTASLGLLSLEDLEAFPSSLRWSTPGLCGGRIADQLHNSSSMVAPFPIYIVSLLISHGLCGNGW